MGDGPAMTLVFLVACSPRLPLRAGDVGAPRVQAAAAPEQKEAGSAGRGGPTNRPKAGASKAVHGFELARCSFVFPLGLAALASRPP